MPDPETSITPRRYPSSGDSCEVRRKALPVLERPFSKSVIACRDEHLGIVAKLLHVGDDMKDCSADVSFTDS